MKILLIGLGKMGFPLALNMRDRGHEVLAFDTQDDIRKLAGQENIGIADSLPGLISAQTSRRVVWVMVPAGAAVDQVLDEILPSLNPGDIIIDGGNSHYKDSIRRGNLCAGFGTHFLDCGTSGGVEGARKGVCAMIGGDREAFDFCEPLIQSISLPGGYLYTGVSGTGHFVKMVHNGIEYGMMQAIGEGFALMHHSGFEFDLKAIAELWNRGSVIRGWLMELTASALTKDPGLDLLKGIAQASGEAQWMLETALEKKVSIPVTALALLLRYQSQDDKHFSAKMVAALRNEFGGHAVVPAS